MKKNSFFLNKYTVSLLIILVCIAADVYLHKGMTRVIIPEKFTSKRSPQEIEPCYQALITKDKHWMKAINTVQRMEALDADAAGFEMDVYFDTARKHFLVYHDTSEISQLNIEAVLDVYATRKLSASIWLDFKNLSRSNQQQSLVYVSYLRSKYGLANKMIIESPAPQWLPAFCDSGFYTSYYTPYFNPYLATEMELIAHLDTISNNIEKYPVSALSGYYFQYPVLKKYFPNYPILTWTNNSGVSLVANSLNRLMLNDSSVAVLLFPGEN